MLCSLRFALRQQQRRLAIGALAHQTTLRSASCLSTRSSGAISGGAGAPQMNADRLHPNLRGLGLSPTLEINMASAMRAERGETIFRTGFGQSPFPVHPLVIEALRTHAHQKDYLPVQGLPLLREQIAHFVTHTHPTEGGPFGADDLLIGPGSKELIFLLLSVLDCHVLIPAPAWVSYAPQAQIVGRPHSLLNTTLESGWHVSAEELDRVCESVREQERALKRSPQQLVIILNSPGNPDGQSYTAAEYEALVPVLRRHSVLALSDEIYSLLHYGELNQTENQHTSSVTNNNSNTNNSTTSSSSSSSSIEDPPHHVSLSHHYPEATVVTSGLSKWCGAGGWRLGYMGLPSGLHWLRGAMCAMASETFSAVSAPIQHAAAVAYSDHAAPHIGLYLRHQRRILHSVATQCARILQQSPAVEVLPAQGGFYLFLRVRRDHQRQGRRSFRDGAEFCSALMRETGVALLPGAAFMRDPAELSARFAFVDFDGDSALRASARVGGEQHGQLPDDFAMQVAPRTIASAEAIVSFLN